jgi:hypothetical protein
VLPLRIVGIIMREYHFYLLDAHSRIQSKKIAQCADDLGALEVAQSIRTSGDIEIWQEMRMVTRLNTDGYCVAEKRTG